MTNLKLIVLAAELAAARKGCIFCLSLSLSLAAGCRPTNFGGFPPLLFATGMLGVRDAKSKQSAKKKGGGGVLSRVGKSDCTDCTPSSLESVNSSLPGVPSYQQRVAEPDFTLAHHRTRTWSIPTLRRSRAYCTRADRGKIFWSSSIGEPTKPEQAQGNIKYTWDVSS